MPTYYATGSFKVNGKLASSDVSDADLARAAEKISYAPAHTIVLAMKGGDEECQYPVNSRFFSPIDGYHAFCSGRDFQVSFQGTLKIPGPNHFESHFEKLGRGEKFTFVIRRIWVEGVSLVDSIKSDVFEFEAAVSKTKPKGVSF